MDAGPGEWRRDNLAVMREAITDVLILRAIFRHGGERIIDVGPTWGVEASGGGLHGSPTLRGPGAGRAGPSTSPGGTAVGFISVYPKGHEIAAP